MIGARQAVGWVDRARHSAGGLGAQSPPPPSPTCRLRSSRSRSFSSRAFCSSSLRGRAGRHTERVSVGGRGASSRVAASGAASNAELGASRCTHRAAWPPPSLDVLLEHRQPVNLIQRLVHLHRVAREARGAAQRGGAGRRPAKRAAGAPRPPWPHLLASQLLLRLAPRGVSSDEPVGCGGGGGREAAARKRTLPRCSWAQQGTRGPACLPSKPAHHAPPPPHHAPPARGPQRSLAGLQQLAKGGRAALALCLLALPLRTLPLLQPVFKQLLAVARAVHRLRGGGWVGVSRGVEEVCAGWRGGRPGTLRCTLSPSPLLPAPPASSPAHTATPCPPAAPASARRAPAGRARG